MINQVLEIKMEGWTATPRMPFILSGNAVCLPVPTYSILLGVIGCCLGRLILHNEVKIGFHYQFDSVGYDLETRQRLENKKKKIKPHPEGTDAYNREFHILPKLIMWIDRIDWEEYFRQPMGTPALGRSQDLLKIISVQKVKVKQVKEAKIGGCMIPFLNGLQAAGQLVQLAEAYQENEEVGSGRTATASRIFIAIPHDNKSPLKMDNLFEIENTTTEGLTRRFYLHEFVKN